MANVSVKILDPADPDAGFLSVDEARILLNLGTLDAAATTSLTMQITMVSQTIMRICNRQFGRERVTETWRGPDELIEDAVAGYFEELTQTREMLNSRYDDLKSGKVKPISGDKVVTHFREKSAAHRTQPGE